MKRFVANFVILLVLTVAITAVLAMLADAPTRVAEAPADSAAATESAGTLAEPAAADETAATAPADDTTEPAAAVDEAAPVEEAAAVDTPETEVAGVVAQATLPDTGPVELLQWLIIGAGIVATGGMVRGAARDWSNGDLTLL